METSKFWILTFIDTFSTIEILLYYVISIKKFYKKLKNKWIKQFVKPEYLIKDQGRSYLGSVFARFLEKENIKHLLNGPYNPQGNGIAERINKEILHIVVKCTYF